jgi:putative SOS response-associated peptidase YedK
MNRHGLCASLARNAKARPLLCLDRMPLVLDEEDFGVWLGEVPGDPAALLRPALADGLLCRPKGRSYEGV